MKFFGQRYICGQERTDYILDVDPDLGIFWRILRHCEIGHFSTFWLIFLEKLIESSWKFYQSCIFRKGSPTIVPLTFCKSSGSRTPVHILTRFALVQVESAVVAYKDFLLLWVQMLWVMKPQYLHSHSPPAAEPPLKAVNVYDADVWW